MGSSVFLCLLTYPVNENTWENEVKYVEEGPSSKDDIVSDVRVGGIRAAGIVGFGPNSRNVGSLNLFFCLLL